VACFASTGAHDFMLHVVAADLESFGALVLRKLLKVPGVRDVQSSLVLDTLKRSARLPLSHLQPRAKLDSP
jgi:Lrp/AsnC family leucine-responsive transcriptional regulator